MCRDQCLCTYEHIRYLCTCTKVMYIYLNVQSVHETQHPSVHAGLCVHLCAYRGKHGHMHSCVNLYICMYWFRRPCTESKQCAYYRLVYTCLQKNTQTDWRMYRGVHLQAGSCGHVCTCMGVHWLCGHVCTCRGVHGSCGHVCTCRSVHKLCGRVCT